MLTLRIGYALPGEKETATGVLYREYGEASKPSKCHHSSSCFCCHLTSTTWGSVSEKHGFRKLEDVLAALLRGHDPKDFRRRSAAGTPIWT